MARLWAGSDGFGQLKKPVDGTAEVLHNLVSLLLMQQTQDEAVPGGCEGGSGGAALVNAP